MPRAAARPRVNYMADFESTTDPLDTRIWAWGMVEIDKPDYDAVEYGHTMKEFMNRAFVRNANIYFHNLRFDGGFIIDHLLRNGYTYATSKLKTPPMQFTALISKMGHFYSITVANEFGITVEFRDSAKRFAAGMSVKKVAEAYGLDVTKGEIDYHKPRPVGYVMDEEEIDYLKRDIIIVAEALRQQNAEGMSKLTIGADALAEFKRGFGKKRFDRVFPPLPNMMDDEIRRAYRGGWTYADKRFSQRVVGEGIVLDVNSLYPSVMYMELLPYGHPEYSEGLPAADDTFPLSIFSVTFIAKLKPNHVPCIQLRASSMYSNSEYAEEIKTPETLWVTNVDWELWNEHYDIEVFSYNGGWRFRGAIGLFDDYIDKWMAVKASSIGGRRDISKLFLNSLYGKFATNPDVTGKIPVLKDNRVVYELGPEETRAPVYTAMGAFITAYARMLTIRSAQVNYATFAYADTDSLHLLRPDTPSELRVHKSDLGAWKFEYRFQNAMYVRSKLYLERKSDGTFVNAAAGLPKDIAALLRFEDMWDGNVIDRDWVVARTGDPLRSGKLQPKSVPGGIVLEERQWKISFGKS